ncbi:ATP-binding protein [Exiguobacterium acetylicum]|uniref:ATP-binding protein n=1 Tax=Exiguobacterium acetylicum TaxID=41170 RepID=UPI001EE32518|nr:ATP-binding protein [Exiguobacterium acetylicum]UKS57067.1 cell wall metabolism sensor histidine kinase WalK [Exiguobacterium acetylicum]
MKWLQSVVIKLWGTILLLVSVVLIALTILLLEFFNSFHIEQERGHLAKLGQQVETVFQAHSGIEEGSSTAVEITDIYGATLIAKTQDDSVEANISQAKANRIIKELERQNWKAIDGEEGETAIGNYETFDGKAALAYRAPLITDSGNGTIYLIEQLTNIEQANEGARQIIQLCVLLAIIGTTVFAFFLSTRITAPLRTIRQAVVEAGEGKFDQSLTQRSRDEIGDLALAFNEMSSQLNQYVTDLDKERHLLSSILRCMADGVLTFSKSGELLATNPPAEAFLAGSPVPDELIELFQTVMQEETEMTVSFEREGRFYIIIVSPLLEQEEQIGAVAVLRDMTEAQQLEKMRADFVANVSHELRTPLVMLQGYSEAIVDGMTESDEATKEFASIIYDESQRLSRLVNDLLDLARMEAGYQELRIESVEAVPFAERVIKKFKQMGRDKQVTFSVAGPNVEFDADPDQMEQVLTNLLGNALRYTENGEIKIKIDEDRENMTLSVIDSGDGIPEEDLPFVFDRFYKADKARTRGKTGTGIGLAIVANVVRAHGGDVEVDSRLGEGATFRIRLPKKQRKRTL